MVVFLVVFGVRFLWRWVVLARLNLGAVVTAPGRPGAYNVGVLLAVDRLLHGGFSYPAHDR